MRDKIFYISCLGFIFGVLLRSFFFIDFYLTILVLCLAFVLIIYFTLLSKNINKNVWAVIFFVFTITFSLGILRFHIRDVANFKAEQVLAGSIDQKIELKGIVVDDPVNTSKNTKLTVKLNEHKDIRILVSMGLDDSIKYGDEISFKGKLELPENFITDTGKEFDYVNYLKKDKVYFLVSFADVEVLSENNGNFIKKYLFKFKNSFLEKINYAITPPESNLMAGLILGERANFSKDEREAFIRTGTIHIIALSGYNITIVAEWFMKLFKFLPINLGLGMGMLAIILFVIMTGGASTGVRAGIMATLVLVARATGRTYDVGRALILAGIFMIIFNPMILAFDVSFQLSFIATVAVIFLTPRLEKYFMWVPAKFSLRDIVAVTFSAYIFVLPFILYKMGNLSLVALPANILVLPFIPLTMLMGFITGGLGFISSFLSLVSGYVSYLFLHYELGVINFLSNLSFASYTIKNFPFVLVILIYIYFMYFFFGKSIKKLFESVE